MTGVHRVIGLIGGSGIYDPGLFTPTATHQISTPWGSPSAAVQEGRVGGLRVLFLPRHGPGHAIPAHRVNYRANIDALAQLGADTILSVSSVGSLQRELKPGDFVLPTQFVDFTKLRPTTFYDGGKTYHVSMADPFCPELLGRAATAGQSVGAPFHTGKTYVCVEGPRFSTRAESRFFRGFADIIGMTLVPEVTLARERALCYGLLAMVTDYDVWAEHPVDAQEIVRVLHENVARVRGVLATLLPRLDAPRTCECAHALDTAGL
ncbi:MAG TPA: S-methyl-5'-thioadenosine phosphorylase [Thermoplasmata archaeon]|nr:S-methyl-5'-thioadenosine phosphorylase [Thermoplasmata archaeon]